MQLPTPSVLRYLNLGYGNTNLISMRAAMNWTLSVCRNEAKDCHYLEIYTTLAGDLGLICGLGRSLGEGNGYSLQYSGLENSMDRGAWQAIVHGVAKSQTWLSDFHLTAHHCTNRMKTKKSLMDLLRRSPLVTFAWVSVERWVVKATLKWVEWNNRKWEKCSNTFEN